jgi:regulatory protein
MEEGGIQRRVLTPEQAYVKIRHYCAFQERTHVEVKKKLSTYGINWTTANELVSKLIEEGFLNEERFARSFAGGKFRMKGWGRKKIEMELKMRQVSAYSIKKAISEEIDPEDYEKTLFKLLEKKWNSLKSPGDTSYTKQAKTRQYLLARGYENEWISRIMKKFRDGQTEDNNDSD